MVWCRPGDKPLSEPMMFTFLTHVCAIRPQWANETICSIDAAGSTIRPFRWFRCVFFFTATKPYAYRKGWKRPKLSLAHATVDRLQGTDQLWCWRLSRDQMAPEEWKWLSYRPWHGHLARYITFRVAHAPGMPGMFSPPLRVIDPDTHYGTCVTHVQWCMLGSLTSGFHFEVGDGGNFPGIPDACATHNLTYLVRGPWQRHIFSRWLVGGIITCQNLHFGKYVRLSVCYLPKFSIFASMFVCRFVCLSVRFVKHNSWTLWHIITKLGPHMEWVSSSSMWHWQISRSWN